VRVIGVGRTKKPDRVWCQLGWRAGKNVNGSEAVRWSQVQAQVKTIREHWNLKYSAVFILCPVSKATEDSYYPEFVSISRQQQPLLPDYNLPQHTDTLKAFNESFGHWASSPTANLLPVMHRKMKSDAATGAKPYHNLSVCVKPLHYNFNRADQLVEFIEIHRLLGASHFTFYNHSVGEQVDCILRRYMESGLVEVLSWQQLDVVSQKEIRTEGIFASLNDCLYRHMFDSQFLLMIDLDELIVPRGNQRVTLTGLLEAANRNIANGSNHVGAYYFRNAFFYLTWPDDTDIKSDWKTLPSKLVSLHKTRRNSKLHPHRVFHYFTSLNFKCLKKKINKIFFLSQIRSKYVCKPRAVVEVGNHFVW